MYQQQINAQFTESTRQFADAAAQINRLAIKNAEHVFGLQLAALADNANATFAFWNKLTDVRDMNDMRDVIPAGVQAARESVERIVATGQQAFESTTKSSEAIAQVARGQFETARGEFEKAATKATQQAEAAVESATKTTRGA